MSNVADDSDLTLAIDIMLDFSERTGLLSGHSPKRYLWTDAFAVCNFLSLHTATGEDRFKEYALALIGQVHNVLGCHRSDDSRQGWISGLSEAEGRTRPLAGGLRIGKSLNERAPDAVADARQEWDQDGQYFHYLTKWMHALHQAGTRLNEPQFIAWAVELSRVAHRAFVYELAPGKGKRMYWKMRIDLSGPLVTSMGQHDPLDGLVTCSTLQHAANQSGLENLAPQLQSEIKDYRLMSQQTRLETDDPLGLGGLLFDAARLMQVGGANQPFYDRLVDRLLIAARSGLEAYMRQDPFDLPVLYRLAFRELGLAIGLTGLKGIQSRIGTVPDLQTGDSHALLKELDAFASVGKEIERTWLQPHNHRVASWTEHRDINAVMLATCLLPDGFLSLSPTSAQSNG